MKRHHAEFPITLMCRVLGTSRSGFYDWLNRKPSLGQQQKVLHEVAVRAAHNQTRQTYGTRRLHKELLGQGHTITRWQVRKTNLWSA